MAIAEWTGPGRSWDGWTSGASIVSLACCMRAKGSDVLKSRPGNDKKDGPDWHFMGRGHKSQQCSIDTHTYRHKTNVKPVL